MNTQVHRRREIAAATSLPPEPLPGFGPTLPPITQPLTLKQTGAAVKPIKLKVKVSYTVGGAASR